MSHVTKIAVALRLRCSCQFPWCDLGLTDRPNRADDSLQDRAPGLIDCTISKEKLDLLVKGKAILVTAVEAHRVVTRRGSHIF
jgi:hypothetical protein